MQVATLPVTNLKADLYLKSVIFNFSSVNALLIIFPIKHLLALNVTFLNGF